MLSVYCTGYLCDCYVYIHDTGGDIVAGEQVPLRGIVDSVALAASVCVNGQQNGAVALPACTVFTAGTSVKAVLNAPDDAISELDQKKDVAVYGHYGSIFSEDGVSAMFNGYIASSKTASKNTDIYCNDVPSVVVGDSTVQALEPVNMINPVESVYFYDAKASSKSELSKEDGIKRILAHVDNDGKNDDVMKVFAKTKVYVIKSMKDI